MSDEQKPKKKTAKKTDGKKTAAPGTQAKARSKPKAEKKPRKPSARSAKIVLDKEAVFKGSSDLPTSTAVKQEYVPADIGFASEAAATADPLAEMSPLERKLADPVLPELPREDRARLQMQSPNRLYFYWSIKNNPFKTLTRAFGSATGSYALAVKLVNHTKGSEEIYRVEPEGNWWFNVDPDCVYRAEVGFYAPNRPYIRIIYSNFVRTPRRSPSWRTDYVPRFTVTADEFAEVLDASGYSRDAFEVALAGDDREAADSAARGAISKLLGNVGFDLSPFDGDELRFVLLALASGYTIGELKGHISEALFEKLMASGAQVSAEQALASLQQDFDVETEEVSEVEEIGSAVFGLSAVNFPKRIRTRRVPKKLLNKLSKFDTVSSAR